MLAVKAREGIDAMLPAVEAFAYVKMGMVTVVEGDNGLVCFDVIMIVVGLVHEL